jgi:hypothetical protein
MGAGTDSARQLYPDPLDDSHLVVEPSRLLRFSQVLGGGPVTVEVEYAGVLNIDRSDRVGLHGLLCHELAHYWTGSSGPFTADHFAGADIESWFRAELAAR